MSVKITRIPEISTIYYEMVAPMNPQEDVETNMVETAALKKEVGAPVYRIIDIREFDLSFSDMMESMGMERDREGGSSDPEVITCFLGDGELVKLGTQALAEQDQYGKGRVYLFRTLDEAKEFIREDRAKS